MNYAKGGPRILMVCVILIWLICGGVTAIFVFGAPPTSPIAYSASMWRDLGFGTGIATVAAAHIFRSLMTDVDKDVLPPSPRSAFLVSLWGMAATFIGWITSFLCIVAKAGGWEPPLKAMFTSTISAAVTAASIIAIIWFIPVALFYLALWIWEGFTSN